MKIFLDVGAHIGQTLDVVIDPIYKFDLIHCFEPSFACCNQLTSLYHDPRIVVHNFGLLNEKCQRTLHGAGTIGATVYLEKYRGNDPGYSEVCYFEQASEWFAQKIRPDDIVYMKVNCEGAECDILADLMDSGEIVKVDAVMVDFDVRKIPSQRHREVETLDRLKTFPSVRVLLCNEVMVGRTHAERTRNWLSIAERYWK